MCCSHADCAGYIVWHQVPVLYLQRGPSELEASICSKSHAESPIPADLLVLPGSPSCADSGPSGQISPTMKIAIQAYNITNSWYAVQGPNLDKSRIEPSQCLPSVAGKLQVSIVFTNRDCLPVVHFQGNFSGTQSSYHSGFSRSTTQLAVGNMPRASSGSSCLRIGQLE